MAEFNPVARVLDTYTPPSTPTIGGPTIGAGSQWRDLANALASFHRPLDALIQSRVDEAAERELAEGERLQQEHRVAFKEAVRQGLIPEGSNPYLRLGYLKAELRMKGREYRTFLMEEWSKDGAIQNAEADAIPAWAADKTAQWRQANLSGYDSKLISEVFDPAQEQGVNQLIQYHIGTSFERASARARETLQQEIATIAEELDLYPLEGIAAEAPHLLEGAKSESEVRVKYLAFRVQELLDDAIANGMAGADANAIAIGQIAAVAELTGDRSILDSLNHIKTGSGVLGKTQKAKDAILRVNDAISVRQIREENLWWTRREREREEARRAALSAFFSVGWEQLQSGGVTSIDPIEFIRANDITDPQTRADILQTANALINAFDRDIPDDDVAIAMHIYRMHSDPDYGFEDIVGGLMAGQFDTPRALQLAQDLRVIQSNKDHPLLKLPSFQSMRRGVADAAKSIVAQGLGTEGINAAQAQVDLDIAAMGWLRRHPEARVNPEEFQDEFLAFMRDEFTKITKHYNQMAQFDIDLGGVGGIVQPLYGAQQQSQPAPAPAQPSAPAQPEVPPAPQPQAAPQPAPEPLPFAQPMEPTESDIAELRARFEAATTIEEKAAIMDEFDQRVGRPQAAAEALGLI